MMWPTTIAGTGFGDMRDPFTAVSSCSGNCDHQVV